MLPVFVLATSAAADEAVYLKFVIMCERENCQTVSIVMLSTYAVRMMRPKAAKPA